MVIVERHDGVVMKIFDLCFTRTAWCVGLVALGVTTASTSFAQSENSVNPPIPAPVSFSPGIRDIVKMLDAKVDVGVIQSYIKHSPTAFNPTASEIIELKQRGVPDELVTALIQRGAEVRTQLAQAQPSTPMASPNPTQTPGYASDYPMTAPDSSYPYYAGYGYGYPYYGYGYGYPYNYWWNTYSYWPWYYSPFYCGFHNCYHSYGYCHGYSAFNHFHGAHSVAFAGHSHGAVATRSAAWAPTVGSGFAHRPMASQAAFAGRSFAYAAPHSSGLAVRSGGFAARSGGGGGHGGGGGGHGGGHR